MFDFTYTDFLLKGNDTADDELCDKAFELAEKRVSGMPIQYVIGEWDFMGHTFSVGEGVLIPRPETEILCEYIIEKIKNIDDAVVIDLCSGSGCIGLSVAKEVKNAKVFLVEKSDNAFGYLKKNSDRFGCDNVIAIKGDIFSGFESFGIPEADLILSNPPYIESADIAGLQSEVLLEPSMALDGGEDGLDFYRAINEKWLGHCNGAVAVECGEGQSDDIRKIFSTQCAETYSVTDFNGIERVVIGRKD